MPAPQELTTRVGDPGLRKIFFKGKSKLTLCCGGRHYFSKTVCQCDRFEKVVQDIDSGCLCSQDWTTLKSVDFSELLLTHQYSVQDCMYEVLGDFGVYTYDFQSLCPQTWNYTLLQSAFCPSFLFICRPHFQTAANQLSSESRVLSQLPSSPCFCVLWF